MGRAAPLAPARQPPASRVEDSDLQPSERVFAATSASATAQPASGADGNPVVESGASATTEASASLPPGWAMAYSNSQQKNYFFHARDRLSLWSLPEVLECERVRAAKRQRGPSSSEASNVSSGPSIAQSQDRSKPQPQPQPHAQVQTQIHPSGGAAARPGRGGKISMKPKSKRQIQQELDDYEALARKEVSAFLANKELTQFRMGPCTKDQRYLLNEVADDENLRTQTEFEEMTKHTYMILYRQGHHPDEILEAKRKAALMTEDGSSSAVREHPKRKRVNVNEPVPISKDGLVKVGVKSDRRTIEEIQRDMQSRK
mmetsp:Transcript_8805/g.15496  ORF Transcript_8805/g.15496 Transcript_8805/m.15496 type:complete len:316 (+) Transcript_8805:24-971(+)